VAAGAGADATGAGTGAGVDATGAGTGAGVDESLVLKPNKYN